VSSKNEDSLSAAAACHQSPCMADALAATRKMSGRDAFAAATTQHWRLAATTAAARCMLAEAKAIARRALDVVAAAELAEAVALAALKHLPKYALAASPFALLDLHGSLRLVK
jgi:hypothetical protein